MKKILIVDDELGARESLRVILDSDYEIFTADNYDAAMGQFQKESADLILLDICMPEKSGLEFLRDFRQKGFRTPVVMVTATKTLRTAVEAMKQGACDYITKPFEVEEIREIVKENIETREILKEMQSSSGFCREEIIGYKTSLKPVFKLIDRLSSTDSTVLILGESGTGKEMIARALHKSSSRSEKNFIPVHLSAISENLIESELFGHVKGSFTGADKDRKGAFEIAGHGTIFLDEIGEIKESIQVKLLRVIQEREFKPVGDSQPKKTNARVITATNKDLYQLVKEGKFRADLYYRLNVVPITLPPLRDRMEDISELTHFLVKKICRRIRMEVPKIDASLITAFQNYDWPGNIRELENSLENMLLLSEKETLTSEDLPPTIQEKIEEEDEKILLSDRPQGEESPNVFDSMEREAIQTALIRNNGILTSTAKYLGTTRRILKYKMDKLGIDKSVLFRN